MRRLGFAIVWLAVVASVTAQRTLHVPARYPTIGAAVGAAVNGDTVLVQPGRYVETFLIIRGEVTVRSAFGPWVTTIDVNGGPSVYVESRSNLPAVLDGFTITGATYGGLQVGDASLVRRCVVTGNSGPVGGGVAVSGHNVVVERCIIAGNVADWGGGIGASDQSTAIIRRNVIAANVALMLGGGIKPFHGRIESNRIVANVAGLSGGGIHLSEELYSPVVGNVIAGNVAGLDGGGVCAYAGGIIAENNTIAGNRCVGDGGGLFVSNASWTSTNEIIWGNAAAGRGDEFAAFGGPFSIDHAILRQSPGSIFATYTTPSIGRAVIDVDPGFVDLAGNDCHLLPGSFAVDAGIASTLATVDFEGDPRPVGRGIDLGADEVHPRFWVGGDARPGGTLRLRAVGNPGQTVVVIVAGDSRLLRPGLTLPGIGTWSLVGPVTTVPIGAIPASGQLDVALHVPMTTPVPLDMPMQAAIGLRLADVVVVSFR